MRPSALGLLRTAYVVVAAVLTATVVPRLGVPSVWAPDLVLIGVVATAVLRGPTHGAIVGLLSGWVVELVPPVAHPMGLTALTMMVAGALAGVVGRSSLRPAARAALALLASSLVVLLGRAVTVAAWEGSWRLAEGLPTVLATLAAALVVLPTITVVDHALVRRRLG